MLSAIFLLSTSSLTVLDVGLIYLHCGQQSAPLFRKSASEALLIFKLVILFVTIILSPITARAAESDVVKICYIPIGVETYVPVTVANIDHYCSRTGSLWIHDERYMEIEAILKTANVGTFLDGFVRVKITTELGYIYIDNHGGVKMNDKSYHIDNVSIIKISEIIEQVTTKNRR